MRVAIVIERLSFYRLVGPIVDEALRRGWDVECWHDYSQPQTGAKGYLFPSTSAVPSFCHGRPVLRTYDGASALRELATGSEIDAILSFRRLDNLSVAPGEEGPLLVGLQDACDSIFHNGLDGLLAFGLVTMHTDWWLDWTMKYLAAEGYPLDPPTNRRLGERVTAVGFPSLDQRRLIDAAAVRKELGVEDERPVVVFLPFAGHVNKRAFWPNRIYLEDNRLKQALSVIVRRRFQYASHIWHGWTDRALVKTLHEFCRRQDAFLIVKSRLKTPIPEYLADAADVTLYDDSYYPASILEVLSAANLCVSFNSAAVIEAAACGVPHLSLTFAQEDLFTDSGNTREVTLYEQFYDLSPGGLFNFQGVSTTMSIPSAIGSLGDMTLRDFALEPSARSHYMARFAGPDDCASSRRLLDAVVDVRSRQ